MPAFCEDGIVSIWLQQAGFAQNIGIAIASFVRLIGLDLKGFLGASNSNVIRCLQTLSAVGALVNFMAINECAQDAAYFRKKLRGIMLE